jgi:hypothetical protein
MPFPAEWLTRRRLQWRISAFVERIQYGNSGLHCRL